MNLANPYLFATREDHPGGLQAFFVFLLTDREGAEWNKADY